VISATVDSSVDSSVYIRALHLGGPAALLIGHAKAGNIRIDLSDPILDETLRVLRDKFGWSGAMLHDARGNLQRLANCVTPTEILNVIEEDPDDNRILECASAAQSDFIVSEDKDLLRRGQFGTARIVSIRDFVKLALTPGLTQ
jgi:putative PIN family toxin of toxin-antitoxin system